MNKMPLSVFLNKETIIENVIKFCIGRGCCLERMTINSCNINGIGKDGVISAIMDNVEISEIVLLCALDISYTEYGVLVCVRNNIDRLKKSSLV